jgi:hypothetical protein
MKTNEQLSTVIFDVDVPFRIGSPQLDTMPKGKIGGVAIPGEQTSEHRRYYGSLVAASTLLPRAVALNIIGYHEEFLVRQNPRRNCLAFAEAAQGRPHHMTALFEGDPPVLPQGSYEEIDDPEHLIPGASYGLMTPGGTIKHAIVGLREPNRHIDVFGRRGQMRIGETQDTMTVANFEADRLVLLTDSYVTV